MSLQVYLPRISCLCSLTPPILANSTSVAIKTLTDNPNVASTLESALRKYNEEQFTSVKLPGASESVVVSAHNKLSDGRYFDIGSRTSWDYDHVTHQASNVQSYSPDSPHNDLASSLHKTLSKHVSEHYPAASFGIYPQGDEIHILTVSSKYSPANYYNGRIRAHYAYSPSSNSLTGTITVDVHYYEDGNVRLLTNKEIKETIKGGSSGSEVGSVVASVERKYQEELNRGFSGLSEGAFRGLRRQLPVNRTKIAWERVSGYRVGQDIGGARR